MLADRGLAGALAGLAANCAGNTFAPTRIPASPHSRIPGQHLHGCSNFGNSGPTIDVTDFNPTAAGAAGAMISTTGGVTRFFSALLSTELAQNALIDKELCATDGN